MKRFTLFIAAMLCVIPLSGGFVRAAETIATADASQTDFETRRTVLLKVFELSKSEILDLQFRLESIDRPTDPQFVIVYETLNAGLEDHLDLIESRIKELNSNYLTLDGVRVTADNFKKWRETTYDPGTQELFDFLILQQGNAIFSIVDSRYELVAADVAKLKESLETQKAAALEAMFSDAGARLENAELFRDAAQDMFFANFNARHSELSYKFKKLMNEFTTTTEASSSPIAEVMDSASSTISQPAPTVLDDIDMTKETVQSLIKRAVDEIAETYKIFLQMRDLVRQN